MTQSLVLAALSRHGEKEALRGVSRSLSYAELAVEVARLVPVFSKERAVALCMENSPAWVVADLACLRAGAVCVPLPPFFTDEQVRHTLKDAGVSLVVTDRPERFQGNAAPLEIAGLRLYAVACQHVPAIFPQGVAKITYTSGTTGHPKGVCLTQAAMETVAQSLLTMVGRERAVRHLSLLPLAVLLENIAGVYPTLIAGGACVLPPVRHEPLAMAEAIFQHEAASCILVPELLRMLLATGKTLPSLQFAAVGGAKLDPALLAAARARGIPVYEGYGLSEAASVVALNVPEAEKTGSVGRLLPHANLRFSDEGEILLRNPLFSGYLGGGEPPEEWYATGDLGRMDEEGFLFIEGRKRHVFITSYGRNVSPEWPESLLTAHPAILQAAVFGEARPYAAAVIVPRLPQEIPAALEQVNARLPDYARIGAYVLAPEAFSLANGQMTGTGRNRREAIQAAYAQQIEQCYQEEKTA